MALEPSELSERLTVLRAILRNRLTQLSGDDKRPALTRVSGKGAAFCKKFFRRMLIWVVAFAVAFYLPITEAGFAIFSSEWQTSVIAKSKFGDVFLATVAMVVLSASDLVDNIIASKNGRMDPLATACAWALIVVYFLFVLFGMPAYAHSDKAPDHMAWSLVEGLLLFGILGEVIIANTDD